MEDVGKVKLASRALAALVILFLLTSGCPSLTGFEASQTPLEQRGSSNNFEKSEPNSTNPTIEEMIAQVSEQDLEKYIQDLQDFGTRYAYTAKCNESAQYIYDEFAKYAGLEVESQYFVYNDHVMRNVVATLPGFNTTNNSIYIISAHYDSYSYTDPYISAPGADDDASGVAAVLETAKIFSKYRFESTVRFVTFSAEELGLLGSRYYAGQAKSNYDDIEGVIQFDMIGYTGPDNRPDLDIIGDNRSEWLVDLMNDTNNRYGIEINFNKIIDSTLTWSDHSSFWDERYDAICGIEDQNDFNPYYHTPYDTIEKLNLDFVNKTTRLGLATLAEMANVLTPGVGAVNLDKSSYMLYDTIDITLYDTHLNANPAANETTTIEINSTTETTPEIVTLTETNVNSSVFAGTINTEPGTPASDGILQVTDDDITTATYHDEDPSGTRTDNAAVDDEEPVISGITTTPDATTTRITWTTNEDCNSTVYYGDTPSLGLIAAYPKMTTSHSIQLTELKQDTTYYFDVKCLDAAGNTAIDNNSGMHYIFTTLKGIYSSPAYGYAGWVRSNEPGVNYFTDDDIYAGYEWDQENSQDVIRHGAAQFNILDFPTGMNVTRATVKLYGQTRGHIRYSGEWNLQMLDSSVDDGWASHGYSEIHGATIEATIPPTLQNEDCQAKQWEIFTFTHEQWSLLEGHVPNGVVSFRVDGPTSDVNDNLFTWDTGYGVDSLGPEYSPVLTISYSTTGDITGPSTSNANATPNPTSGARYVTLTALVSDSTNGNSNISAAEYFIDVDPGEREGTPMSVSDKTFDSPVEEVTAKIDVSTWEDGLYTIYVRGMDAGGVWGECDSVALNKTSGFDIPLIGGWNLISIPLEQSDTSIDAVLKDIAGQWDIVRYYNATENNDHWKTNATFKPNGFNDLTEINHKMAIWINITDVGDGYLTVGGSCAQSTEIPLYKGWNFVGYPSSTDRSVSEALASIPYEQVEAFDENSPPYYLKILKDDYIMTAGNGYWIKVSEDCTWIVNN